MGQYLGCLSYPIWDQKDRMDKQDRDALVGHMGQSLGCLSYPIWDQKDRTDK